MQNAYAMNNYAEAKEALQKIFRQLGEDQSEPCPQPAAASRLIRVAIFACARAQVGNSGLNDSRSLGFYRVSFCQLASNLGASAYWQFSQWY
jgi:hypothetical protein